MKKTITIYFMLMKKCGFIEYFDLLASLIDKIYAKQNICHGCKYGDIANQMASAFVEQNNNGCQEKDKKCMREGNTSNKQQNFFCSCERVTHHICSQNCLGMTRKQSVKHSYG